jgi:hypothetical protein
MHFWLFNYKMQQKNSKSLDNPGVFLVQGNVTPFGTPEG